MHCDRHRHCHRAAAAPVAAIGNYKTIRLKFTRAGAFNYNNFRILFCALLHLIIMKIAGKPGTISLWDPWRPQEIAPSRGYTFYNVAAWYRGSPRGATAMVMEMGWRLWDCDWVRERVKQIGMGKTAAKETEQEPRMEAGETKRLRVKLRLRWSWSYSRLAYNFMHLTWFS